MGLERYNKKRDFNKTSEPKGHIHTESGHLFVVQKHAARQLHYDFRLELDGVLKSWAVPKGPCLDPSVKRLAIHVEDHPIEYGTFEGMIPKGEYGGGTVMLWDKGYWIPLDAEPLKAYEKGHLRFELQSQKLTGRWDLIRFKGENEWFLIKHKDEAAKPITQYDIEKEEPLSVLSHQSIEEIAEHYDGIWTKKGFQKKTQSLVKNTLQGNATSIPKTIHLQLATLVDKPPHGDGWLHEVKFDGYRMMAIKNKNNVSFISRNHIDWSNEFQSLIPAINQLNCESVVLDGEVVVLDKQGRSDFQLLQNTVKSGKEATLHYYVFDLLYLDKYDLRELPLIQRKALLAQLIEKSSSSILYSDHILEEGDTMFRHACEVGLEGIVSKRMDSPYIGKRTKNWLKIKCIKRQEFIIGGFSQPQNSREYFGSLYLGVFNEQNELVFSGNVGTGFSSKTLKEIYNQLKPLISKKNPFNTIPPMARSATWVKPQLIAEVEFSEWTEDGHLRHPSFKGLRVDKKPQEIHKENELAVEMIKGQQKMTSKQEHITLTHPEKIVYKEDHISKQQLYDYYELVSEHMLPYIVNRPLTLVRCPSTYESCFYQKHLNQKSSVLYPVPVENKKGETEQYIYLKNKKGLLSLVQMGVLEIHPWGSTIKHLEYPDILIFDLDPAPDVEWKKVVAAAFDIKEQLAQYKLQSFVKTTGGKGLHVVIPIKPEENWDDVKIFTHTFVEYLEQRSPEKYISKMTKSKRTGKIFLDYLRNQHDATAIGPYSTRARLHAPVATPLEWDELSNNNKDNYYTIATIPKRLQQLKQDPWEGFWTIKQSLHLKDLK